MEKMKTPSWARENGFTIDDRCYPWLAYKGSRFLPDEHHRILTDKEAELVELLNEAAYNVSANYDIEHYYKAIAKAQGITVDQYWENEREENDK